MSLSVPFCIPSLQPLALHVPIGVHTFEVQSPETSHPALSGQAGQAPPPQSSSVSVPFCTPSVQVAA
jgi:hypothetical protein